jgi:hypothetical protein
MNPNATYDNACRIGSNGAFGITTARWREFEFFYQAETTSSMTSSFFEEAMLPLLESAIADRLLPLLFKHCRESRRTLQRAAGSCEAQGYSRLPIDKVLPGGENVHLFLTRKLCMI